MHFGHLATALLARLRGLERIVRRKNGNVHVLVYCEHQRSCTNGGVSGFVREDSNV
jgi:hypothetical protein